MQLSSRLLSFPLAKYSRAEDVPREVERFKWSHIQHNLTAVIEVCGGTNTTGGQSAQMLRVYHGAQILEAVPIQEMISQAEEVIRTMLQLRVQVKNEQLPISALTRRPLFALRYNLPDEKVRRMQLKFISDDDFDKFYNHLGNLGLRMSTSGGRPSTASVQSTGHSTRYSGATCPPTRLVEISNRPSTALASSYVSPTVPKVSSPLARHSVTVAPRDEEPEPNSRPTSSSTSAGTVTQRYGVTPISSFANPLEPPEYFPRPASSSSSLGRPSSSPSRDHGYAFPTIEEHASFPTVPSSAAMLSTHRKVSESALPPRRELPFARSSPPKSSGSDTAGPSSRPSSGTMGPPPLPAPSQLPGRTSSSSGQYHRAETTTSPGPQHAGVEGTLAFARPKSASSVFPGGTFDLPPLPQPTYVNSKREELHHGDPSPVPYAGSTDQPSTAFSSFPPTSSAPAHSDASYQDRVVARILDDVHTRSGGDLAAYAARSEEDRRAILNDFMMKCIDDDGFLALVEDVSTCWARVGLGLG